MTEKRALEAAQTPKPKRPKPETREDMMTELKRQVLYYFSKKNLVHDKFFQDKMRETEERWLPMEVIMSCRRIVELEATREDIFEAIAGTELVVRDDKEAIRTSEPLPEYEPRRPREKREFKQKNRAPIRIHASGVLVAVSNCPAEVGWAQVKQEVNRVNEKAQVNFNTSPDVHGVSYCLLRPFEGDVAWVAENLASVTVNGQECPISVVHDQDTAHRFFDVLLPPGLRSKLSPKKMPLARISLGGVEFSSVNELRKNTRELLELMAPGSEVKASALPVMLALLKYHPEAGKADGVTCVKVDWHPDRKEGSDRFKCFMAVKADGSADSFSYLKCVNNLALDPPFVKTEETAKSETPGETAKSDTPVEAAAPGEKASAEQPTAAPVSEA